MIILNRNYQLYYNKYLYLLKEIYFELFQSIFPSGDINIYYNKYLYLLKEIYFEIIQSIFPSGDINIYYNKVDNFDLELSFKNLIFNNKKEENGIAYIFYEGINSPLNIYNIFSPKIFVIIFHYQYYSTFNKICQEIHNLFYSYNNQILIELQVYNIIIFVPVPIDKRLDMTLFHFYYKDIINK